MGILDRVSRVVRANINDLLDSAEDPEKLFDQHIVDMEDSLREARGKVVEVAAQEQGARKRLADRQLDADRWRGRAEDAVRAGDDDLARKALGVRRGVLGDIADLERQVSVQAEYTETLTASLAALEGKVAETKEDRKRFKVERAKEEMAAAARRKRSGGREPRDFSAVTDRSAFDVFDDIQDKVDFADLEAEAMKEVEAAVRPEEDEAALERRFRDLARARETDDDLSELKRRLDGEQ